MQRIPILITTKYLPVDITSHYWEDTKYNNNNYTGEKGVMLVKSLVKICIQVIHCYCRNKFNTELCEIKLFYVMNFIEAI